MREAGGSLISDGDITLNAAGDIVITGHLVAPGILTLNAGGVLGTFEQEVLLEVGSIAIDVKSSVTLGGHISGLKGIDIRAEGNVNLLDGGLIQERKGLNVYVQSIAKEQELLQALEENLKAQADLLERRSFLESELLNRKTGQNDVLNILKGDYLNQVVTLPYNVLKQQLQIQYGELKNLLNLQSVLPDRMEDMSIDLGDGERYWYTDLVSDRNQILSNITVLENIISQTQSQIIEIEGDIGKLQQLNLQLDEVQNSIVEKQTYQQNLAGLLVSLEQEIIKRGIEPPQKDPDISEVTDIGSIGQLNISQLSNNYIGRLYVDLTGLSQDMDQQLTMLQSNKQYLLNQITENQGSLKTYSLQLQDIQEYIELLDREMQEINNEIGDRSHAMNWSRWVLNSQDYNSKDYYTRDYLMEYQNLFSEEMQGALQSLSAERRYSLVDTDITKVQVVLNIVSPLVEQLERIDYLKFDTELRRLSEYKDYLISDLWKEISGLLTHETLATIQSELGQLKERIASLN
ncbi:MAG: hypothetical protein ACPL7I_09505, partial [Myxococcota bacterium]